ncbi:hypothetical protein GCM10011374_32290 [Kocuria dechangensis]|uniref:Uncharacterized protein n=1 Tax=Kocuria dechangensis TaxID=1176249 RepID=A0A917LZH4_9MICC|nr:hypothetical protein [Kocuria dechangensis]GGG65883.1 hypothetical protein GCM10011374_32290 [Kocuria dechangensis]
MSAQSVLATAETKLLKAKRTYAKKVLGVLVEHLHHHYPQAVRVSVYADQRAHEYFIGELLDSDGQVIGLDPGSVVAPRQQIDGPFGQQITVGPHSVTELLHHALVIYEGPLEKRLRTDRYTGEHYLDLTRTP